jgi:hypothetical protein
LKVLVASALGLVVLRPVLLPVSGGCWGLCMVVIIDWPGAFLVVVVWSGGAGEVVVANPGCAAPFVSWLDDVACCGCYRIHHLELV